MKPKIPRKTRANKAASQSSLFCTQNETNPHKLSQNQLDYNSLQSEWYDKAAQSGYHDLEAPELSRSGPTMQLRGGSLSHIAKAYDPVTLHYYRMLSTYLVHNSIILDEYGTPIGARHRSALEMYIEGIPYRTIIANQAGLKGRPLNLWSLSKLIKHIERLSFSWNKTNPKGLNFIPDIG